jgi:carboxymethylenebutenolidase
VVLVVSEIFGVHEYIADVCRRLAKEGYLAIAPELFARYGDPRKYDQHPGNPMPASSARCRMPA